MPLPLRIVQEESLGLSNACQRGLKEARFEIVSFISDDNWVDMDWINYVHEIMENH
jgi:hypothetical protein